VRQFVILLAGGIISVALYKIMRLIPFLLVDVPFFAVIAIFAFAKVNGMPFHFFLLNLVQTLRKPRLRVWDKKLFDFEVKQYMVAPPPPPPAPFVRKVAPSGSHLQELTLLVNTGGAYKPEE
jgi:hypothetical protein